MEQVTAHFILYVADEQASAAYWSQALALQPALQVPGMTEFHLRDGVILGLMPDAGIRALLGESLPDPAMAAGTPRSEVYLVTRGAHAAHRRAIDAGGTELSAVELRGWGHRAGYILTPDGHVLAFAEAST